MTVTNDEDNNDLPIATAAELRKALTELAGSGRAQRPTVYMTVGDAEMVVGVRADRGILYWQCNSRDDAVAIGGANTDPVMYGANEIRMPAASELPLQVVLDAAEEFSRTAQQPTNVSWIRYRDTLADHRPPKP
jgi:hypothetical protein